MEKALKFYGLSPADINTSYFDLVKALKSLDRRRFYSRLPMQFITVIILRLKTVLLKQISSITMQKFHHSIFHHQTR